MIPVDRFDYAPSSHTPRDWQNAIEEVLAVIDGICRENSLKYSLAFGGLLGAIRHRGMIPWDNDADIVMFEEDYLKFRDLCRQGRIPEGYQLVDRSTEDDYSLLFGRFIDTRTACPLSTSSYNGGANGVFIDMFILFPVPEEPEEQIDCITDFLVWEELQCHVKRRCKNRSALFAERWQDIERLEAEAGHDEALRIAEERFRSKMPATSSKCIHGSGGAYNGFPVLDTAWFENPVRKPFGSHDFLVPNGYLSFFRRFYGDSWRMFPSDVRFSPYSCANLNMPGNRIVQDYMQFIDQDKAMADFDGLKQLKMREMLINRKREPLYAGMRAELAADDINKKHRADLRSYRKLLTPDALSGASIDLQSYASICERTIEVIRYQLAPLMKAWRIALPYNPTLLSMALWSYYLVNPDFWTVEKVISRQRADRERCVYGKAPSDSLLDEVLAATGDLYEAIDCGDADMAQRCLAVLEHRCPSVRHAKVGRAFILLTAAREDAAQLPAARDAAEDALQILPDDDYLQLFAAQSNALLGKTQRAEELFARIAAESMNGMVLLWSSDFCLECGLAFEMRSLSSIPAESDNKLPPVSFPQFDSAKARLLRRKVAKREGLPALNSELKSIHKQMAPYQDAIDEYHALRRLSNDRFYIWEKMFPRKQALLESAAAGKMDEVRTYARPYLDGVYRLYDKDHRGLFIDEEILQACLPLIEEDRGAAFAEDYVALIPPEHRENIDEMLRRRGIDHPYLHRESFLK